MKLDSVKVFVVGNPPPPFGGRYFVFLKLKTDDGIEGVGEVYAATFGPQVIGRMIEDVFARRFVGRDPFQIESLWREAYGSGFSLRPDISLIGVLSGLEMACWDIIGKAVGQPVYDLLGGQVHERLRSYTYFYPAAGEGDDFYHDADARRGAPRSTWSKDSPGSSSIPRAPISTFDPRQPTQRPSSARCAWCAWCAKRWAAGGPAVRDARPVHRVRRDPSREQLEPYDPLWFEEPVPPEMPEEMAMVARGRAFRSRPASG